MKPILLLCGLLAPVLAGSDSPTNKEVSTEPAANMVMDPRTGAKMQWPPAVSGKVALVAQGWEGLVDVAKPVPKRDMSAAEGRWRYQRMESQVARGGGAAAWHVANYYFGQTGNLDCARSLLEFGVVPSVRRAGLAVKEFPLHAAAMRGDSEEVVRLIDEEGYDADTRAADDTTPLVVAAAANQTGVIEHLLERGADVHASGHNGMTPAHIAASQGFIAVLELLVTRDVDLDTKHKFAGSAPIHFAAEMGEADAVKWLCRNGADVDAEKVQGGGALHIAAELNQTEVVRALVSRDCNASTETRLLNDTTPIYLAAQNGNVEAVRLLLSSGADSAFEMPVGETRMDVVAAGSHEAWGTAEDFMGEPAPAGGAGGGSTGTAVATGLEGGEAADSAMLHNFGFEVGNGATALHAAVENGHLEVVKALLSMGTPQTASMEGATPVYVAAEYGQCPEIMEALLGAPDGKSTMGVTVPRGGAFPLYIAAQRGRAACVKSLLEAGADVNQHGAGAGATALFVAVMSGHAGIAKTLLDSGADVNATTAEPDRATALHAAAESGRAGIAQMLLEAGATVDARSGSDRQTALHMALGRGRRGGAATEQMVAMLLQRGADVNARVASTGATPLMMACRGAMGRVAAALVRSGADVHARAGRQLHGAPPLYLATVSGARDIVAGLLSVGADPDAELRSEGGEEEGGAGASGVTPLMAAVDRGDEMAVAELLGLSESAKKQSPRHKRHRATPNRRDGKGRTALHYAAQSGRPQTVPLLLRAGADVDARRADGSTALMDAITAGYKADGTVAGGGGERRGAHRAPSKVLRAGAMKVAEILLQAGADVTLPSAAGETPVEAAQRLREFDSIKLLQDTSGDSTPKA
jgi:ankyrin repeat protein